MSDWIFVDERLPEKAGDYLVYIPCKKSTEVNHFTKKEFWNYHGKQQIGAWNYVSHWISLPEPPNAD